MRIFDGDNYGKIHMIGQVTWLHETNLPSLFSSVDSKMLITLYQGPGLVHL